MSYIAKPRLSLAINQPGLVNYTIAGSKRKIHFIKKNANSDLPRPISINSHQNLMLRPLTPTNSNTSAQVA